jgi:hypothetical protein
VSWNDTTKTLTLTGAASLANYQTLLGEVTSQDTGIDTSAGSHPIRDVTWTISDGAFSSSAASEGGMRGEQKITLGDMRQSGESRSPGRQSETATSPTRDTEGETKTECARLPRIANRAQVTCDRTNRSSGSSSL